MNGEEHLLPLASYFEPKVKIITGKVGQGEEVQRPVFTFVFVPSGRRPVNMTLRSSEILSHGRLTVFEFKGFFLIGTKVGNGASLCVSEQPTTVSLETHHL